MMNINMTTGKKQDVVTLLDMYHTSLEDKFMTTMQAERQGRTQFFPMTDARESTTLRHCQTKLLSVEEFF